MDLSWSHRLKTDAPTLVKDLRKEVKKHMDFITANISKLDNVSYALCEGEKTLGTILCRTCRKAVESKRSEIHSKNETVQKRKKLQKLSPERQQILNEITNNFIKLERSENEDEGEEYCTEGEYYREEMLEMESMYKNMLYDKQDEMAEIENKHKKVIQDKETELKKLANDKDELKKKLDLMSKRPLSYGKMETELRELKREKERLKDDLDKAGIIIKKLKREIDHREEDIRRYRPSSSGYRTRWFTNNQADEISRLKVELDLRDKELQTSKKENENLKTEKNELIGRLENFASCREMLEKKCDELNAMKSQLVVLQKAKNKHIEMKPDELNTVKSELENLQKAKINQIEKYEGELDKLRNEYDKYVTLISQLETEKLTLQDKADIPNKTNEEMMTSMKSQQEEMERLKRDLEKHLSELDKIQKENERCVIHISQLETDKMILQDQRDSLEKNNEEMVSIIKSQQEDTDILKKNLEKHLNELGKIQKENEMCVIQISHLETEKQALQDQTDSLNKTNAEMASRMKSQHDEMGVLKRVLEEKHRGDFEETQKERDEYVQKISQLEQRKVVLEKQTDSLLDTIKEMSSSNVSLQRNIEQLTGQLDEKQLQLDNVHIKNEQYIKTNAQIQTEKQTLLDQTNSLHKENRELVTTLEGLQLNVESLTGKLEEKQIDFEKITQKEKDEYVKELSQLQQKSVELQSQSDTLTKTNKELSSTIVDLQRDVNKLTGRLEEKQYEFDEVKHENNEYVKSLTEIQTERRMRLDQTVTPLHIGKLMTTIESLHLKVDKLTGKLEETQCDLHRGKEESERYTGEMPQLQREMETILEQLRSIKCITEGFRQDVVGLLGEPVKQDGGSSTEEIQRFKKKLVVMGLLRTNRSGLGKAMVDMVTKELKKQVGRRLDSRHFDLSIVLHETSTGVTKGPLFVACLNEMIERNIQEALEGPKGGRDVYLLVLHQTTRETVSTLRRTSLRNTGIELRQLGGVIDMVFSSESGLFECDVNSTAVEQITTVLKKY